MSERQRERQKSKRDRERETDRERQRKRRRQRLSLRDRPAKPEFLRGKVTVGDSKHRYSIRYPFTFLYGVAIEHQITK